MIKIVSPHDKCFKAAMAHKEVAKDFFFHHLPDSVKQIVNLDTLELRHESFVGSELKLSISDLLFATSFSQKIGYLYLIVEHQSSPDILMPFRLLEYMCGIFKRHLKQTNDKLLPIVYPMVFYHGTKRYAYSRDLFDLFGEGKQFMSDVLFKPFHLIDVNKIDDDELNQHKWSGALELIMKHIFTRDILVYVEKILKQLKDLEQQGGRGYIINLLEYLLLSGREIDQQEFVKVVQRGLSSEIQEQVMTIAEQLRREGKAEGRAEGWREGRLAEKLETALNLLRQGIDSQLIVKVTGLPLIKIEQMKESLHAH